MVIFEQTPSSHIHQGAGCPICNNGFSKKYLINLLNTLENSDLINMDPFEIYTIISQGKLPNDFKTLSNSNAHSEERLVSISELRKKFESEFNKETVEILEANGTITDFNSIDDIDEEVCRNYSSPKLPNIDIVSDIHSLDNAIYAGIDDEAISSLVQYKLKKFWNHFLNGKISIESLENEVGGKYFTLVKEAFLTEYEEVFNYQPKEGFSFTDNKGILIKPSLMQKLTVVRLLKNKSYGNWSGTGAGKTLSFILASRELDSRLTIVIALNSTIEQTGIVIKNAYNDSVIHTSYEEGFIFDRSKYNYLILNYEKFQQNYSEGLFQSLTNLNQVDFTVIDEVHNTKQVDDEGESIRRQTLIRLLGRAREFNNDMHTLVMSATPVINNLFEAKSLLMLMTGLEFKDLETRKSIYNAMKIFQQLTINGLRYIPEYNITLNIIDGDIDSNLNIDGSHLSEELIKCSKGDVTKIEKILLRDKLLSITPYLKKGVVVYSHYTTGIVSEIKKYIKNLGYSVGTYTGEENPIIREINLNKFKNGELDILIGSKPIGTGVDGLQEICNRLIIITLPWTYSEFSQLKGRFFRQGSVFGEVDIIIPQVKIQMGDNYWSWDIQRMNRINNKKTLADAAVDGVVPSTILPSIDTMLSKAIESLKLWQIRVEGGEINTNERVSLNVELYPDIVDYCEREKRINSELMEFNRKAQISSSRTTNKLFNKTPELWYRYHKLRNERAKDWSEVPYEYIASKIVHDEDVIADFGCGENKLKLSIPKNKVYSFDHIAIDDTVEACDMSKTTLLDDSIDVAVFSLALWGTNKIDYLKEAHRVLRRKGIIYIAEPFQNYQTKEDEGKLLDLIHNANFKEIGLIENRGKFIYLTAIKL